MKQIRLYILTVILLLVGGLTNEVWASKVTYHVLTLPMQHRETVPDDDGWVGNTKVEVDGERVEAITVIVDNATIVELPAAYKSPLAHNFRYYDASSFTKNAAKQIYANISTKFFTYSIKASPTLLTEGQSISQDCEIYVTYEYNADNKIAKLDGSESYNIKLGDRFLCFNKGRSNRPATLHKDKVSAKDLTSNDFVKIDNSGVTDYYNGHESNTQETIKGYFHFLFKYMGLDPYNITIYTAYEGDETFVEKDAALNKNVKKWYKGSSIFNKKDGTKMWLASDDNKQYKTEYDKNNPGAAVTYDTKQGFYRGKNEMNPIWNSFALLDSYDGSGYVFMGSKLVVDGNGTMYTPTLNKGMYQYYFLWYSDKQDNNPRHMLGTLAKSNETSTDEVMYEPKIYNFKVTTPFGNIITASFELSEYSVMNNENIDVDHIPTSLRREYCEFENTFYRDAAHQQKITKYSDLTTTNDIYVTYKIKDDIPFKPIKPTDSYTTATWYELTDENQTTDRKIKWNGSTYFQNNGASNTYDKTSEFAFVGDPYELRVLYRNQTETDKKNRYVYGSTNLGVATTDYTPNIATNFTYGTNYTYDTENLTSGKKTLTFTISGLDGGKKIKVTKGGTDGTAQVDATTPTLDTVTDETGTTETITVTLNANAGTAKTMTITIQQCNDDGTSDETTPTVITINQLANAYSWEIPEDDTEGSFVLQQFGSNISTTTSYWQWDTASAGNNVTISAVSTRIKTMDLPKRDFTYKIVDKSGRIAVTAKANQTIFSPLSLASIPSIIISPFILDEKVEFYSTYSSSGRKNLSGKIEEIPQGSSSESTPIFVKYTTTELDSKPISLSEDQEFNVKLNGKFIYYNTSDGKIYSADEVPADENEIKYYLWKLRGRDPYAMLIDNMGARVHLGVADQSESPNPTIYDDDGGTTTPTRQKGAWLQLTSGVLGNAHNLVFTINRGEAQQFIAKSSLQGGIYEVMVATGEDVDASTNYYNIGRPSDNTVKVYYNDVEHGGYAHGNEVLKFELETTTEITYHLIDLSNHELLTLKSKSPDLSLPAEYQSPLVSAYSYYNASDITNTAGVITVNNNATKILKITEVTSVGKDVYVTYETNDLVKYNDDSSPYLLKFLDPLAEGYYLEDGNDKLTAEKIKAVYPYTNGDGNLNIYGELMNEEQMNGGASTRPRWVWFFDSDNDDPYHVKIHSKSTISYKNVSHPTYLQTYAVHFNQDTGEDADKQRIVTGGVLAGIASIEPTEYMVLGTKGQYKLLTTNKIAADLNGDKDTADDDENERRYVTSFEQYWKTYNMVKLHVLGISKTTNSFSNNESTFVVPNDPSSYRTTLTGTGSGQKGWHSYKAVANATRWNGYNDKEDGKEKKVVETLEHWFQTFSMGNGTFDIISANIPPVLVLLDRHGWEIMRKPLPTSTYPYGDELDALKVYDSPMVKEYHFYSNATKASGCHKYTLRTQNGALRDEIKVNGTPYTSTSLGELPPLSASGVKDGTGAFNDQYVTYTVKDEYEKSFKYSLVADTTKNSDGTITNINYSETYSASKFLILQNGRYYRDKINNNDDSFLSKPISQGTNPEGGNIYDMIISPSHVTVGEVIVDTNNDGIIDDRNLWYVQPNLDIDDEMGISWATEYGSAAEPFTRNETKAAYKDKTGFDPYNLQIRNADNNGDNNSKFLTTKLSTVELSEGVMKMKTQTNNGVVLLPKTTSGYATGEGYDHTSLQITNQTFMAVSDANGNMQLMPRFDHTRRVNVINEEPRHSTLEAPVDHALASVTDNSSMGPQTTFMVRPQKFEYHIIDNKGREALRYKLAGEDSPTIPNHFKSPLANNFKFYFGHAAYTLNDCTRTDWTNHADGTQVVAPVADKIALQTAANALAEGTYYYQIGSSTNYKYVHVTVTTPYAAGTPATDAVYTTEVIDASTYDAAVTKAEVADDAAMETAAKLLTADCYYKVGPLYTYKKVVVTGSNNAFTADVAAKKDISSREITGSFADAGLGDLTNDVYVRYSYDEGTDTERDNILQGPWFTMSLSSTKNVQASGKVKAFTRVVTTEGDINADVATLKVLGDYYYRIGASSSYEYKKVNLTNIKETPVENTDYTVTNSDETEWTNALGLGVSLLSGTKPVESDVTPANRLSAKTEWHWKFLAAPMDPSSELYEAPDPYAIQIFNRKANYSNNLNDDPNPMSVGIKVNSRDRFAILSHPNGDYALAVAGLGSYTYEFLNGADITELVAATTTEATGFTSKSNALVDGMRLIVNDDIEHTYTYKVITDGNKFAVSANQTKEDAFANNYSPILPDVARSPLLNMDDYKYYGSATESSGSYTIAETAKLNTLRGLYDDMVYVRYNTYDMTKSTYKVPNKRNATGSGTVAKDPASKDATLDIGGNLVYNIIWKSDDMMQSNGSTISGAGSQNLGSGTDNAYVWQFVGGDPYAIQIKHKTGKYADGTSTLNTNPVVTFMLLDKTDDDYGVLYKTGDKTNWLNGADGVFGTSGTPTKFIIFALATGKVIYHLVIKNTNTSVVIPARKSDSKTYVDENTYTGNVAWDENNALHKETIPGTTQRDLTNYGFADKDAGVVSLSDPLQLPNEFYRPNCRYYYFIEGIYDSYIDESNCKLADISGNYKGLKVTKMLSTEDVLGKIVKINVVYSFDSGLDTNAGDGFVTDLDDNLWYTLETNDKGKPYLAHYTNAWGLQAMAGRETHYTNDYLWSPLGDAYGFKMYNRYMIKNSGGTANVMTSTAITEGKSLFLAEPGVTDNPDLEGDEKMPEGNEIYELLGSNTPGYFRIHPVVNQSGDQYYVRKNPDDNYAKLSKTYTEWRFGLGTELLTPYIDRVGYVGGLKKAVYEDENYKDVFDKVKKGTATAAEMMTVQGIVYNDDNIIKYAPGYYRLHNQPGVSGISPVRYASGYLHAIEKGSGPSTAIPLHFYSKVGVTGTFDGDTNPLKSGFTGTAATRGDIPVPATEYDPSTIFYFDGAAVNTPYANPTSKMSTQGLYVAANPNGDSDNGTKTSKLQRAVMSGDSNDAINFTLMDIGGAVLLIHDGATPATRRYLNFDQTGDKYDLKYYHESPADDAKWCMVAADSLLVATNNGGNNYYYTTFCAPYDVELVERKDGKEYKAFVCTSWLDSGIQPIAIGEVNASPKNGNSKFVPAGTPVIIRTNDDSGNVKFSFPSTRPSSSRSCVFTGKYLEQLLDEGAGNEVYTLGLQFTSSVTKDANYNTNGKIDAPVPDQAKSGIGFYINANPNKEYNASQSLWLRNNRYVLHNKIYYRAGSSGASAPQQRGPEFVPVIFDDEEQEELNPDGSREVIGDGCVYDLMGRKVATREQVEDGSWKQRVATGIYIINGKKIRR